MTAGSPSRGSSCVMTQGSAYFPAAAASLARFVRSRSPALPKTALIPPLVSAPSSARRAVRAVIPVSVVRVEDGGLRDALVAAPAEHLEQDALRLEVRLHGPVEVEVLRAEVGEHRDVDVDPADLPQRERMRCRLEHAPRATRDEQLGAELLELQRLLSALARLVLPLVVRELEVDRRGVAGALAGGLEDVRYEVHRGRLPIGAGDRGDLEGRGRGVEELRGEV